MVFIMFLLLHVVRSVGCFSIDSLDLIRMKDAYLEYAHISRSLNGYSLGKRCPFMAGRRVSFGE